MPDYHLEAMSQAKNYQRSILSLITRHLPMEAVPVLDYGAGHGDYAIQMVNAGYRVEVYEPDASAHPWLQSRGLLRVDHLTPGQYAAIYSLNVFEHIAEDAVAMADGHAALKPAGLLLVYVPAHAEIWTAMDDAVGHQRRYTRDSLQALFQGAGFEVLASGEHDFAGYWVGRLLARHPERPVSVSARNVWIFDRLVFPCGGPIGKLHKQARGKNVWVLGRKQGV